jgi:exodeoxyribonuclease VII small subunit
MPAKKNGDETRPGFEDRLKALEKVVEELEGDALSLEASIERYKEGVGHLAACRKILDGAEQRLAELVATADGGVAEVPLRVGPEGLEDASAPRGGAPAPKRAAPRPPSPPPPADDEIPF